MVQAGEMKRKRVYGSSHWEPATASWSWRVSQAKPEREEFEGGRSSCSSWSKRLYTETGWLVGEGARAAAGPSGPGRATPHGMLVVHPAVQGLDSFGQGVPGAVRARVRPEVAFGVPQGVLPGSILDPFKSILE